MLASCKQNAVLNETQSPESTTTSAKTASFLLSYYSFINQRTDVSVGLKGFVTTSSQNQVGRPFDAYADARKANDKLQAVTIGEASFVQDPLNINSLKNTTTQQVKPLYGTTALFTLKDFEGATHTKALYIPKIINVNPIGDKITNIDIKVGVNITWNKDAQNTKGVIFVLRYVPTLNPSISSAFPQPVTKYFACEDTGNYILTGEDVEGLPKNANIDITVGRGGYEVFQPEGTNRTYSLYGYTFVGLSGIIK